MAGALCGGSVRYNSRGPVRIGERGTRVFDTSEIDPKAASAAPVPSRLSSPRPESPWHHSSRIGYDTGMSNPPVVRHLLSTALADVEDFRRIRLATLEKEPEFFGASLSDEAAKPVTHFSDVLASSTVLGAYEGNRIV